MNVEDTDYQNATFTIDDVKQREKGVAHLQDDLGEEREFPTGFLSVAEGTFEWALAKLKAGFALKRTGWNGEGQFTYMVPPASYPAQTGVAKQHFGEGSLVPYQGYFALKNAQGSVAVWFPSVGDLLATDWAIHYFEGNKQ